jgi:hypothetical protein
VPTPGAEKPALTLDLLGVLLLALVFRLAAALLFPVVFDEVQVMAFGLAKPLAAGEPASLVFEVPLTVSNGITPLWYWLQALPAWLFGETTKPGLRTLPVLLGLLGVWLCWRAGARLAGRRGAFLAGLLYALLSPLIVVNARGEFAESLLAPLALLILLDLQRPPDGGPIRIRAAVWPALALFTYFGKGLVLWGSYAVFLSALFLLDCSRPGKAKRAGRTAALILAPLLPSLGWLLGAQRALFRDGAPVLTDLGPVASVAECVRRLTLEYGTGPTRFMAAGWRDALFVYSDFRVWPTLALLAVPCAVTLGVLLRRLARALPVDRVEAERALLPLCLAVPALALLLAKGALDARFHLLYLPVLLPYVALVLDDWAHLVDEARWRPFLAWGLLESAYVSWTLRGSWAPAATVALTAVAATAGLVWSRRLRDEIAVGALAAIVLSLSNTFAGPLVWGRIWAWEPSPLASDPPRPVAEFPNADLQLAELVAAREGMAQARTFFLRALDRHPDDRATMASASEHLLRSGRDEASQLIGRLSEYLRRHPEDEAARRNLATAVDRARGR